MKTSKGINLREPFNPESAGLSGFFVFLNNIMMFLEYHDYVFGVTPNSVRVTFFFFSKVGFITLIYHFHSIYLTYQSSALAL